MYQPQSPIYNHHNYVNGKLASVLNHSHVADPSEVCDIVIIYSDMSGPLNWAQSIIPDLNMKATRFYPVMCINAWQRILTFDEHANMRKNHKFAVSLSIEKDKESELIVMILHEENDCQYE